jgi:mannose-6-phosphate isomerase-like protein (cupin superfamily)
MIVIRNWRTVHPTIAHKSGIDWRLLSMKGAKTDGDIKVEVKSQYQCLKAITYVSLAWLQPSLSYEAHSHKDHEEVYYIISGKGSIKMGKKVAKYRDGDIIYIPENMTHSITNEGDDIVEFLAFGGLTGVKESLTDARKDN